MQLPPPGQRLLQPQILPAAIRTIMVQHPSQANAHSGHHRGQQGQGKVERRRFRVSEQHRAFNVVAEPVFRNQD